MLWVTQHLVNKKDSDASNAVDSDEKLRLYGWIFETFVFARGEVG